MRLLQLEGLHARGLQIRADEMAVADGTMGSRDNSWEELFKSGSRELRMDIILVVSAGLRDKFLPHERVRIGRKK